MWQYKLILNGGNGATKDASLRLLLYVKEEVSHSVPFLGTVQANSFLLLSETHRSIRVHSAVLMRFRLSTLKLAKTVELHVVTHVELYAHATITRACDIFSHGFHFDAFSTDNTICMHFSFDHLLSRAFSNRCVFDENAQSIRANGRPKCIKMYAILKRNVFVWRRSSTTPGIFVTKTKKAMLT